MREFYQWVTYYQLEPFGEHRGDIRIGLLGAGIATMLGGKRTKPEAFMPDFESGGKSQSVNDMMKIAEQMAKRNNENRRRLLK